MKLPDLNDIAIGDKFFVPRSGVTFVLAKMTGSRKLTLNPRESIRKGCIVLDVGPRHYCFDRRDVEGGEPVVMSARELLRALVNGVWEWVK